MDQSRCEGWTHLKEALKKIASQKPTFQDKIESRMNKIPDKNSLLKISYFLKFDVFVTLVVKRNPKSNKPFSSIGSQRNAQTPKNIRLVSMVEILIDHQACYPWP